MAIKMVREPSATPNINNIDDIIGLRYAYGNQDGYVIGKGSEISATNNGSSLTINSGRLVLQGVECDIDANGVTISVDNIATKRYYVVYLQVNLATNSATITSQYDTAGYPNVDLGDDLTENSNGTARLPIYKFTTQSGVISEVERTANAIEYSGTALVGYDISKGTVEDRLTRLGFRQGSVNKGQLINTTVNRLKRQGNYVIGRLTLSIVAYTQNMIVFTLPDDFECTEYLEIDAIGRIDENNFVFIQLRNKPETNDLNTFYLSDFYYTNFSAAQSSMVVTFGYEAEPL